jgi:dolichol-phosphate mannosyltransferase
LGLSPVPGYATTVIGIFLIGGMQLIALGVIGEYIGRIYEEVKQRPLWVVKKIAGIDL